jgi:hypothetical protein
MDRGQKRARREQLWRERAERVRDAFGLVLLLVLVTYVLASLLGDKGWSGVVLCLAGSATSVVALASSHAPHRAVRAAIWFSALALALALLDVVTGGHLWLSLSSLIEVLLLAAAMGAVLQRVVVAEAIGSRTILGALSVYAVLGILFTFVYAAIARIQGTPFFEGHPHVGQGDFIFFSYTTLTTTGFGDLVPGGQPGRMISGLEMMIGQIFLVTLVAGLVSLWRPGERLRAKRETRDSSGEGAG